jgi:hypothetical protein
VEALAAKRDRPFSCDAIEVKCNLALAVLCTGRFGLALREYDGALELASKLQAGLHRGLVGRTRADLAEAIADRPEVLGTPHAQKALKAVEGIYAGALQRRKGEAGTPPP